MQQLFVFAAALGCFVLLAHTVGAKIEARALITMPSVSARNGYTTKIAISNKFFRGVFVTLEQRVKN